ncbi:MAG: hypothetical protein EXQ90_05370 [Rhodospirillales bacterium]|nr:hypothetical protein [Rhodospirillales bacterium]
MHAAPPPARRRGWVAALLPFAFRLARRAPISKARRDSVLAQLFELRSIYDDRGDWRGFVDGVEAGHLVHDPLRTRDAKKRLFKSAVRLVEFEPHAYCNRQCPFCPNAVLDRTDENPAMNFANYRKAIAELAEIDYRGVVRFARYCEPLACRTIGDYVATARQALPRAEIDIVSNGDYLNRAMLDTLVTAGLTTLRISVYPKGYAWNQEHAADQLRKIAANAGLEARLEHRDERRMRWRLDHPTMAIVAQATDFATVGYDRGQSMAALVDNDYQRTSPCTFVFQNVTIDFDGAVMPCCNLRGDDPAQRKYMVGRLDGRASIFDVYGSEALTTWRRSMVSVSPKAAPCTTCKHGVLKSSGSLWALKVELRQRLSKVQHH